MTAIALPPITAKQRRVWEFIRNHNAATRTGTGYREICAAMGWRSPNASYGHCVALRRKGWITFEPSRPNTIVPTAESLEVCDD